MLKEMYEEVVNMYLKAFTDLTELECEETNIENDVFSFGDWFFMFSDIKFAVDNNMECDSLLEWYDANLFYYPDNFINLPSWLKGLRHKDLNIVENVAQLN